MIRFTSRDKNNVAHCVKDGTPECLGVCGECEFDNNFIEALAAYEDTMLAPEDVDVMLGEFIALTSLDYGKQRFFRQDDGMWYDREDGSYVPAATVILRSYDSIAQNIKENL